MDPVAGILVKQVTKIELPGCDPDLDGPTGVAMDGSMLYVADSNKRRIMVTDLSGALQSRMITGFLSYPGALTVDSVHKVLYVTQPFGDRVSVVSLHEDTWGQVHPTLGAPEKGIWAKGLLNAPFGVCVDTTAHACVYITARHNNSIFMYTGYVKP